MKETRDKRHEKRERETRDKRHETRDMKKKQNLIYRLCLSVSQNDWTNSTD